LLSVMEDRLWRVLGKVWERLEDAWAEGNICKKKGWAGKSLCGIDTRIVDLLHIEDERLLVLLLLNDVEAVPLRLNMFRKLLPLATKYIGKLRLQLMTRRR
jgi:hypothetical protein